MADYVKMWEDLGMDLESHDTLCQVLPVAVGDVFMSQENRPKAMDFWDLVISEVHGIRPAELIEDFCRRPPRPDMSLLPDCRCVCRRDDLRRQEEGL